jgi:hypothetical protein
METGQAEQLSEDERGSRIEYNSANRSLCWKEKWKKERSLDTGERQGEARSALVDAPESSGSDGKLMRKREHIAAAVKRASATFEVRSLLVHRIERVILTLTRIVL